jgi:hypothetical protein
MSREEPLVPREPLVALGRVNQALQESPAVEVVAAV